jgi:hypothetical protein
MCKSRPNTEKTFTTNLRQIQSAEDAQPNREETSAREKNHKNPPSKTTTTTPWIQLKIPKP